MSVARKTLDAIGTGLSLTDEQLDDMRLAIGEACTNAVKFSGPDKTAVVIEYLIKPDTLEILIRNKGREFNVEKRNCAKPEMEKLPVGGMGLYIMEKCMDEVRIDSDCGETSITLVKRIK